jgi:hypothetical protein
VAGRRLGVDYIAASQLMKSWNGDPLGGENGEAGRTVP